MKKGLAMLITSLRFEKEGYLGWLFVFANRAQSAFLIVGTLLIGVVFYFLSEGYPLCMFTAFLGGWSALRLQDKAWVRTDAEGCALITSRLEASGFLKDRDQNNWRPPLSSWMQWQNTTVIIHDTCEEGTLTYRLSAPYVLLQRLIRGLPQINGIATTLE
ncbi:hypothetical protein KZ820_06925 [Sphingomonas sp. RRHST34]|uniref:Uncharacterized protein n=1 Tax=Sphingomonas citri TaxID=2862499 RepID=A0ABS7BM05_9SPHN|nr:hypothetical protein [Sphingomonas citri]MBW6530464.1 hypothetical protein [Sphingomonas citri]